MLVLVTATHAGFQLVVTVVVYPALVEVGPDRWAAAHAAHSRRIVALVAPLYLALAAVCLAVIVDGPSTAAWVAIGGTALACLTTAFSAAPIHGRLGREGPAPALLHRLVVADRVRLVGALVAFGAAAVA